MAKSKYKAGIHFVVTTPVQTLDKQDRKAIRGHATRAGKAGRQSCQLGSWISPHRDLGALTTAKEVLTSKSELSAPSPRRVGGDFCGLQLPSGVEPYMIQDLVKLIELQKYGVYPYDICLNVHVVERGWFPYMISDICCLQSMMYSLRAFVDSAPHDQLSTLACFHYGQTLQLLQARLNGFDQTSAISDSTIMVVITLAQAAELTGDLAAVANHIKGLIKIVSLRGGVRALNTHNNLQVKVCRADLAYALLSGHQPCLLGEGISWDCFIANRGLIQCRHQPHEAIIRVFAETALDARLRNSLRDLHAFSCLSNLAYQTTRKLSPETYNEMMISILYRLTHLSFKIDALQEAVRSGLLAFASAMFIQRRHMEQPNDHLLNLYSNTLLRLREATDVDVPVPIVLWLTMLSHIVTHDEPSREDWRSVWLDEAISRAGIDSWTQAREILKSVVWIDFIDDRPGKKVYESAMLRLGKVPRVDV